MLSERIGLIGAGQMATALGRGFFHSGVIAPGGLIAADPSPEARGRFAAETGGGLVTESNLEAAAQVDVLFLAVKPQQLGRVMAELRGKIPPGQLVVSIVAGAGLAALAEGLGPQVRLVRVMPNTPCLVGRGASAYCLGEQATAADGRLVGQLLQSVGIAFEVEEKLLDAVTGLSGSGPAFVYVMIEALSDGGVRMGLPRHVATALAAQTVLGAGEMVAATGEHPGVLKDRVASPGGTTIAGLQALEQGGLRAAVMAAVQAATQRAAELGKEKMLNAQ
jgi:pyrroline-5-carboxylate reductase